MQHLSMVYQGEEHLQEFLQKHQIVDSDRILLQVFTSENDYDRIDALRHTLITILPQSHIIGTTTDGEIVDGHVVTHETVLSFTIFEKSTLHCAVCDKEDSYLLGRCLCNVLVDEKTQMLIVFADGLSTNGELFLEGINDEAPHMIVAGGLAGDYARFEKTFVFTKEKILSKGAVGIALRGDGLRVFNDYCFNWQKIGKALKVTKCESNRVYEIEGRSAVDTYAHYLGEEIAALLPSIGIEFPLIGDRNGLDVARAVIAKHKDGSLSFAGNIIEGESLHFGYGDMKKILEDAKVIPQRIAEFQAEAIFIYSCMARRNFIGNAISQELEPLQEVAPSSGFFTYGEFFHRQKNELMNQTMTIVALSESEKYEKVKIPEFPVEESPYHSINALIHLLNITSQEVMEQKVFTQSYERFAQLFEYSGDGLVVLNAMQIIECNEKTLSLFGYASYEKERFLRTPINEFVISQDELEKMVEKIRKIQSGSLLFDIECRSIEGNSFWVEVMMTRVKSGKETYYYMVLRDISERKSLEAKLQVQHDQLYQKAYIDDLTGLPNRKSIMERLEKVIESAKSNNESLALLFIDLDKLKVVNDSLGHIAGDKLIQIAASRLKDAVSAENTIARLGGDEFLVLLRGVDKEQIISQAERLLRISREEIHFDKYHLYISASIGIARFPLDASDPYSLLKFADTAMYEAKDRGGNQYCFYSKELTQKAYEQVKIAKEFRRGIRNKEFVVYYQPQIDMHTQKIVGVEALIRWRHPEKGFFSPANFLPAIEKANLLQRLDRWVMNQAMKEVVEWYDEGLDPGRLSLNISMSELESRKWEKRLLKTMKRIGFRPEWLELEITETEIMKQPERVVSLIKNLHTHNITIAIDDFGTGYSSLAQLKYLPFDKLKIDKFFIDDLPQSQDACVLFEMMMTLANNMNVPVLAEGMEREEQVSYLKEVGCHYAQGYYYAKPMDAESVRALLKKKA